MVASVLEGDHHERRPDAEVAKHNIAEMMKRERVKGFAEVVISRNVEDGVSYLLANHSILIKCVNQAINQSVRQSIISINTNKQV